VAVRATRPPPLHKILGSGRSPRQQRVDDTLFKNVPVFKGVDLYEKPELDMGFEDLDHAAAMTRVSKSTPPFSRND
jgi:uncharacterized protein YpbB